MPEMNFIQAINTALAEELRHDPATFMMGLDIWVGSVRCVKETGSVPSGF